MCAFAVVASLLSWWSVKLSLTLLKDTALDDEEGRRGGGGVGPFAVFDAKGIEGDWEPEAGLDCAAGVMVNRSQTVAVYLCDVAVRLR